MSRKTYIVVEGPQDVEVIGRLLRLRGLARQRRFENLDPYWRDLVPRTFPTDGDLLRRVPVPTFFADEEHSVAVHAAGGIEKIGRTIEASLLALDQPPQGVGVIVDADTDEPTSRWSSLRTDLSRLFPDLGEGPGTISLGEPRVGVFVLPNNETTGTLEDLLLDCGTEAYPTLLDRARAWIEPLDPNDRSIFADAEERKDFAKPAGKAKAIVGAVASVLRPGKAIQVSIQDNRWLRDPEALETPSVAALRAFVDALMD